MRSAMPVLTGALPGLDVGGLPLHPLVVHVVVVLLPLSAVGLLACILRPAWRRRHDSLLLIALPVSAVAAFVAKLSGESLAATVGGPGVHQQWGTNLPYVALLVAILGHGWLLRARVLDRQAESRSARPVRGDGRAEAAARHTWGSIVWEAATAVLAVAAIGMTVVTGHSGAVATWGGRAATGSGAVPTPTITARDGSYTMEQIAEHRTAASCWSTINGDVYDLTGWIAHHPGGPNAIRSICGVDGSAGFNSRHAGTAEAQAQLPAFRIGTLLR